MTSLPIKVSVGRMPLNYRPTPINLFNAMIQRMKGEVDSSKVILGPTNTTTTYDSGPAFITQTWYAWDQESGKYLGMVPQIAANGFISSLVPTDRLDIDHTFSSFTQTFPDKAGTVAFLYDTLVPQATVILDSANFASLTIDGNTGKKFYGKLGGNTTVSTLTLLAGQTITVGLVNVGTSYTVTWPGAVVWPASPAHTMPANGTGVFTFRKINSIIHGTLRSYTSTSSTGTTGGTGTGDVIPSNYGGTGNDAFHGANNTQIP